MSNNEPIKKRQPSIFEFFNLLQLEWLCADLRSRIYEREKDVKYWEFVKQGKKVKIDNIAGKNSLPTIFDDAQMKEDFNRKIYKDKGFPNFIYKDDAHRAQQEIHDMANYFRKDVDVRYEFEGETIVCKITMYEPYQQTLRAKRFDTGEVVTLIVSECSRIM